MVVLEDDPGSAEALAALLGDWGYDCVQGDRLEAVAGRLHGRSTDVRAIISDYHLQGGANGVDAIVGLGRLGVAAPALLLSGTLGGRARRVAGAAGHQHMEKPVAPRRLKAWLQQVIGPDR